MLIKRLKKEYSSITKLYIILFLISSLTVAMYGKYRCSHIDNHKDVLEFDLFNNSAEYGLDGWSLSHLFFFGLIGYLFPNTLLLTMFLGALWELFETIVGIYKPELIDGFGFCQLTESKYKVWWYGKWSDIVVNFIGFMLGSIIRKNIM